MRIRTASIEDAEALASIYAPYIRDTVITFETEPVPTEMFAQRMAGLLAKGLPYLVAEQDDSVVGYAYGSPHRARAAYAWSVESSIWVHRDHHRQGIGRALYARLIEELTGRGYVRLFAGVTLPNPGSRALHESFGFTPVGVYDKAGYKHGTWHDVGWWQLALAEPTVPPPARP